MKLKVLLYFLVLSLECYCQQNSIFSFGANMQYGYIIAHSQDVQNTAGSYPAGIQLEADWQKINQKTWDNCYCYPHMGFSLSYFNYHNSILGHSITPSYFLEPSFKIYKNFGMVIRGQLGLSYLTNPYDQVKNPNNMSYSLPVTGYIGLGIGSHFKITNKLAAKVYIHYLHISNGGIKDPNKGIDWPVISLGINYIVNPVEIVKREKDPERNYKDKKIRKDIYLLGSTRVAEIGGKERYAIYGAGIGVSKQVSILNAVTAGAEWHIDDALKEILRRENRSNLDYYFVGILAGNEFLLGKFIFSQQLGYLVYRDVPDYTLLYHRWGLLYRFNQHISGGLNLKAYADHVHFLDFRMMCSF